MTEVFQNPGDEALGQMLQSATRIAIVGLSPKPDRPSYIVAREMQKYGYVIVPVRPAVQTVLDEPAYARLEDVPGPLDMAVIFRAADQLEPVVDSVIARGIPVLWIQEGIINEAAALRARANGIEVVMDRCIYKEYERLGLDQ
ncbi:MAG: CoA-binding protein [Gammaproteobacteria bacterium]|nr:CoA-binding protein [Gammaproteobacteria bacterium]